MADENTTDTTAGDAKSTVELVPGGALAAPGGGEKGIFKNPSKKMIAGLIGFLGLGVTLAVAVKFGAHLYVQVILASGLVSIPPSLIFGLAWMDAVVRGVKAWRG